MANFTMCLWEVEQYTDDIGLNDYPFWTDDASKRDELNTIIRNHYYNREIGVETWQMFVFNMKRRMAEIMPLYNELFKAQAMQFDPLITMRMSTTGTAKSVTESDSTSDSGSESNAHSEGAQLDSTFPQVGMQENGKYATSGTKTEGKSSSQGTANETVSAASMQDGETTSVSEGFSGSQSALIMEYARSRMNVTMMIIEDLSDLFMGVWSTEDDYTHPVRPAFIAPYLPPSL